MLGTNVNRPKLQSRTQSPQALFFGQRFGRQERLWGNEIFPGVPVVVRMHSFIKTEVNVSREVDMLDESLGYLQ